MLKLYSYKDLAILHGYYITISCTELIINPRSLVIQGYCNHLEFVYLFHSNLRIQRSRCSLIQYLSFASTQVVIACLKDYHGNTCLPRSKKIACPLVIVLQRLRWLGRGTLLRNAIAQTPWQQSVKKMASQPESIGHVLQLEWSSRSTSLAFFCPSTDGLIRCPNNSQPLHCKAVVFPVPESPNANGTGQFITSNLLRMKTTST